MLHVKGKGKKREILIHKDEILEQRAAQSDPRLQQQGGCDAEPRNRISRENFGRVSPAIRSRKDPKNRNPVEGDAKEGPFLPTQQGQQQEQQYSAVIQEKSSRQTSHSKQEEDYRRTKKQQQNLLQSLAKKKRREGKGIGAYERGGIYRTRWTRGMKKNHQVREGKEERESLRGSTAFEG